MEKRMEKPDWETNIESLLRRMEENLGECAKIKEEAYRGFAEASYRVAQKKYEDEMKLYRKVLEDGYVIVDTIVNLPYKESAGLRVSKFFHALKEEGKILALRCPECRRVIFSPRPVCGFCRVSVGEKEEDWVELSDTGTITSVVLPTEREVDRATGKIIGEANPCAFIRLDGGTEWTVIVHYLERLDMDKIKRGMRVKAVWKAREQRRGRMSDIAYFRIIEN